MAWPDKDSFLALWRRTTPRVLTDAVEGRPGEEIYQSQAAVYAYLSQKFEALVGQMRFSKAEGANSAAGTAKLHFDEGFETALVFPPKTLTVWGVKHGGKNLVPYQNSGALVVAPTQEALDGLADPIEVYGYDNIPKPAEITSSPVAFAVEAVKPGMDQDLLAGKLCVFSKDGERSGSKAAISFNGTGIETRLDLYQSEGSFAEGDRFRIIEITGAPVGHEDLIGTTRIVHRVYVSGVVPTATVAWVMPPFDVVGTVQGFSWVLRDLDEIGLYLSNDDDIIGGNFFWLDLHASNRGIRRVKGEDDATLFTRATRLMDTISPPAIERMLRRLMKKLAPGYNALFIDVLTDPEICAFFSETGDGADYPAADPYFAILTDPRDDPALMYTRAKARGYFRVHVPAFDPLPSGWTAADRRRVYRSIYDTVEKIKAEGIQWDMIVDSGLG